MSDTEPVDQESEARTARGYAAAAARRTIRLHDEIRNVRRDSRVDYQGHIQARMAWMCLALVLIELIERDRGMADDIASLIDDRIDDSEASIQDLREWRKRLLKGAGDEE